MVYSCTVHPTQQMPLEGESLIGATPELGANAVTQGLVTAGILVIGVLIALKAFKALAKETGIA